MSEEATQQAASPAVNEYEALKAAVEAAEPAGDSGRAEDPPRPPSGSKPAADAMGAEPPATSESASEASEEDLPKIERVLRAREKARAEELGSRKAAASILETAKAEAAKMIEEARAAAKRELEEERGKYSRSLKENPFQFIKEHGVDRERLIQDVAREGTPEWQAQKALERDLDDTRKLAKTLQERIDAADKRDEERQRSEHVERMRGVEKQFLGLVSLDTAPNLRRLYEDEEIVAKGHALARRLREETGESATLEELRDYLEHQAKKRVAAWAGGDPAAKPAAKKPAAPRTLSGQSQSERRATPKSFREAKTPEEEAALLEEVAAAAMKE